MKRRQMIISLAGAALANNALGAVLVGGRTTPGSRFRIGGPGLLEVRSDGAWVKSLRVDPRWRIVDIRESGTRASIRIEAVNCQFSLHSTDGRRWTAAA